MASSVLMRQRSPQGQATRVGHPRADRSAQRVGVASRQVQEPDRAAAAAVALTAPPPQALAMRLRHLEHCPIMGAGLLVDSGRVVALATVVSDVGAALDAGAFTAAATDVGRCLSGAQLSRALTAVGFDLADAVDELSAACTAWQGDVGAAVHEYTRTDTDLAMSAGAGRGPRGAV